MLDMAQLWKPMSWAEETGQIRSALGPYIQSRCDARGVPLFRRQFTRRYDKAIMAQAIRGRMALGGLYVPTRASWYPAFQQELLSFPAGRYDDMVDALALIGQLLDEVIPGYRPLKRPFEYDEATDPYRERDDMGSDAELWRAMGLGGQDSTPGRSASDDLMTM
jgi:predicted phage terminase large subunit-like protein